MEIQNFMRTISTIFVLSFVSTAQSLTLSCNPEDSEVAQAAIPSECGKSITYFVIIIILLLLLYYTIVVMSFHTNAGVYIWHIPPVTLDIPRLTPCTTVDSSTFACNRNAARTKTTWCNKPLATVQDQFIRTAAQG